MFGITVRDFLDAAIDSFNVDIWDNTTGEVVYSGNSADVPEDLECLAVDSFDPPCIVGDRLVFTLNVCTEEDD